MVSRHFFPVFHSKLALIVKKLFAIIPISLERVLVFHLILLKHLYFFCGNGSLRLFPDIRGFTVKLERRM